MTRVREQAAARAAATGGFGPPVVHAEVDALVSEFLPGRTLTEADLCAACAGASTSTPSLLTLVVQTLRTMHSTPVPPELLAAAKPGWLPADVHGWLALAEEKGFSRLPLVNDARALIASLEEAAGPTAAAVAFCHFDPLPDNFVRDGERVWLIDYEYAAAGQPWMDLAILSMGCELTAEAEEKLLAAYLQQDDIDVATRSRFAALKLLACLRETCWGIVAEVSGTSALSLEEAVAYTDKNYAKFEATRRAFFGAP